MKAEDIARICHETNRAYCFGLGDHSQPTWDLAADWQRDSTIKGVVMALEHPETTPEQSHEAWMKEKLAAGWKYGPQKAPDRLEHPCLVPYSELSPEHRMKDTLFLAVVRVFGFSKMVQGADAILKVDEPEVVKPPEQKKVVAVIPPGLAKKHRG